MKRRITKLVVVLLLGVIVNVAVAWGCAYWVDVDRKSRTLLLGPIPFEDAGWQVVFHESTGAIRVSAHAVDSLGFAHWREELGADVRREELERAIEESKSYFHTTVAELKAHIPSWSRANHPPQARARTYYPIADARGWPFVSMRCSIDNFTVRLRLGDPNHIARRVNPIITSVVQEDRVVFRHKGTGRIISEHMLADGDGVRNGILLPARVVRQTHYFIRALPLRPLWPGFAINTIFYAAILWMLTLGPFTARRMIRRKRGLCPECGYDLRGAEHAVCPECGAVWILTSRRAALATR